MKRKLSINQPILRLLCFYAILLFPLWTQAEEQGLDNPDYAVARKAPVQEYGLNVAGVQVTSENATAIMGDAITGTVTFNAASNILTLENATLTERIQSSLDDLTIVLKGTNTIALDDKYAVLESTSEEAPLTITKEGTSASLTISNKYKNGGQYPVIFNFSEINYTGLQLISPVPTAYTSVTFYPNYSGGVTGNGLIYLYDDYVLPSPITFSTVTTYPLWIAGTQVTEENKDNVTGDETPHVSFTPASGTRAARLSLSSADIEGHIYSNVGNLEVYFSGENTITPTDTAALIRAIGSNASLTFTHADAGSSLVLNNEFPMANSVVHSFASIELAEGLYMETKTPVFYDPTPGVGYYDTNEYEVSYLKLATNQTYPLWIGDVQVTAANATEIAYPDYVMGTVSYKALSNTLTLDNATIQSCNIKYAGNQNLTIELYGENNFMYDSWTWDSNISYIGDDENVALVIKKADDTDGCSLSMYCNSDEGEATVVSGFSDATWTGLDVVSDQDVMYDTDNRMMQYVDGGHAENVMFSKITEYDLSVAGVQVTSENRTNITGDGISGPGSVSFDPTSYTLTLDNVYLSPDYSLTSGNVSILTRLPNLNISLVGESRSYAIMTDSEASTITFKSPEESRGAARLNFWYSADPQLVGFTDGHVVYDDGLCLRNDWQNQSFPKIVALYIPQVTTTEKEHGLYFADHQFSFALAEEIDGFDIYYANMIGASTPTKCDGTFTLSTGNYMLRVYPIYPGMNTEASWNYQYASEISAKVIERPTFSVAPGKYEESQTVFLQNLPELGTEEYNGVNYPQVWYYLNENAEDSVCYDPAVGISVEESSVISVFVLDTDSGRVEKSDTVMARYTIGCEVEVAFGQRQWATYCASRNLQVPEGLEAYIVNGLDGSVLTVKPVDYLPARVGVLLHKPSTVADAGTYLTQVYTGNTVNNLGNMLAGTLQDTDIAPLVSNGVQLYVLFNDEFVRATTGTIPAQRAYLPLGVVMPVGARLTFGTDGSVTTGIQVTETETSDSVVFDLSGRRLRGMPANNGLYIIKGKKVVKKN